MMINEFRGERVLKKMNYACGKVSSNFKIHIEVNSSPLLIDYNSASYIAHLGDYRQSTCFNCISSE